MTEQQEKILNQIRALQNKTVDNGCTEEEAMSASKKMGELLDKYNIDMSEIEITEKGACIEVVIDTGQYRERPISNCLYGISIFTDTRICISHSKLYKRTYYRFFGYKVDCEVAEYLYYICHNTLELGWQVAKLHGATNRADFQKGMAISMSSKLQEMKKWREQEVSNCTGLMVLKNQIVEKEFGLLHPKLKKATSQKLNYSSDYFAGRQAGELVDFNKPLSTHKVKPKEIC